VAGKHYPKDGEVIDPLLGDALAQMGTDLRPDPVVYGFVMFSKRITPARVAQLEELGVRNLGFHPHHNLRAAIPVDAIALIANLDFVRWVGVARDWQKVHPALSNEYAKWDATEKVAVFVNVFEDDRCDASTFEPLGGAELVDPELGVRPGPAIDGAGSWASNGWQQQKLEQLGVTPKEFLPGVNAFRADITYDTMQALLKLDFVQFVELEPVDELNHDESVPMIASDYVRGFLDGGDSHKAIVGEIDSGVDTSHSALNHVFGVGWDFSTNSTGSFTDNCAHGTHVAGTIFGLPPSGQAGWTGNAPGVGGANDLRVRMVKYLDFVSSTGNCSGSSSSHSSLYDVLKGDYNDGAVTSGQPHVINNSWGSSSNGTPWVGTEANARTLDDYVFGNDQVYVFSAGNDGDQGNGTGTIGLPAVAKNALTVGSVVDFVDANSGPPGSLADSSSRGPCGDNRWKPNVVAPGRWIRSALAGTSNSYTDLSGTSMAAPHVTGVVAQLVDGGPTFKYNPAKTAAVLMATATQKNETLITTEGSSHLDDYGVGRVNATFAQYATNDSTYTSWSFTKSSSGYSFGDFTVPSGTNRLVVVMHYVEPAASSGASKALRNDFNLYIDRDPVDTANGNTGEYTAQQSSVDNTEVRMIDNPISGPWRWKVWPQSATQSVKMSVVVRFVHDTPHANGTLTLSASDSYVQPNEEVDVTASFFNPDVVASAVYLETSATSTPVFVDTTTTLLDGIVTDLSTNQTGGQSVLLGDITDSRTRSATWTLRWGAEGAHQFGVTSSSDNTDSETASVTVIVDGTDPTQASGLNSSTHTPNVWSNDPNISYQWNPATDALSGLSGYSVLTSSGSSSLPNTSQNIGAVTTYNSTLGTSSSGRYFNLRSVDNAGNWDNTAASTGPYLIDTIDPTEPANLVSSTHTPGVWSNSSAIGFKWNPATDSHSGLAGYDFNLSGNATAVPGTTLDLGTVTTYSTSVSSTSSGWYFSLRSGDVAGNWDDTAAQVGPYLVDSVAPSAVTGLTSTDHSTGVWSNDTSLAMAWGPSFDAHSGLAGYDTVVDHNPGTVPSGSIDTGAGATAKVVGVGSSATPWYFHIRPRDNATNWGGTVHAGPYLIDGVAPAGPSGLSSSTHTAGVWSTQTSVTVNWNAATDSASGLAGYDTVFDQSPTTVPNGAIDAGPAATSKSTALGASSNAYWFHVRARDNAGNWGAAQHFGPILIDPIVPTGPTNLVSSTHLVGALSNSLPFKVTWTPATDAHSGLAGYATVIDESATTVPNGTLDLSAGASGISTAFPTPTTTKEYWLHVRARDNAGNWGAAKHIGPFVIGVCNNAGSNSTYGTGKPGTNGIPQLVPQDTPTLGESSTVLITNAFPGSLPILILGVAPTNIPWDGGTLLASLNLMISLPVPIQANGTLPLTGVLPPDASTCGVTLYHQVLIPDPGATGFYGLAMTPGLARTFGS
ncbi:MAG: S8 family serine peptidase, partial [Planctomycetota bacterium JB042]